MNPFEIATAVTEMLYDISSFFQWFMGWSFLVNVGGTSYTITALSVYAGAGGAFILVIIIRAIIRAVIA